MSGAVAPEENKNIYSIEAIMPKLSMMYYKAVNMYLWNSGQYKLQFPDQTSLPNKLKRSTRARSTCVMKADKFRPIVLHNVMYIGYDAEEVVLHISRGEAIIEMINKVTSQRIRRFSTEGMAYRLSKELRLAAGILIYPKKEGLIIIVEVFHEDKCPFIEEELVERYRIRLEKAESVVLKPDRPVVVMATRYATFGQDRIPIQVGILAGDGKILFNRLICPRRNVRNYGTEIHGIREEDLYTAIDEYQAYIDIMNAITGTIVLGCAVYSQLKMLKIPISKLAGVRELTTNKVFGHTESGNVDALNLLRMYGGLTEDKLPRKAIEEAKFVLYAFQKVRQAWKDDFVKSIYYDAVEDTKVLRERRKKEEEDKKKKEEEDKKKNEEKEKKKQEEKKLQEEKKKYRRKEDFKEVETIDLTQPSTSKSKEIVDLDEDISIELYDPSSEETEMYESDVDESDINDQMDQEFRKMCQQEYKRMMWRSTEALGSQEKEFVVGQEGKDWEELTFTQQAAWAWEQEMRSRLGKRKNKAKQIEKEKKDVKRRK